MEFILNFAWLLLAATMTMIWLRSAPDTGVARRTQFVSLLALILILLPAISMTDDLLAAQNPAEVDCCLRRDHDHTNPHSIFHVVATPPLPAFRGTPLQLICILTTGTVADPFVSSPAVARIQNRPPPSA